MNWGEKLIRVSKKQRMKDEILNLREEVFCLKTELKELKTKIQEEEVQLLENYDVDLIILDEAVS